ncbi:MAG: hypothetical protein QMC99_07075 [Methanocella conradii]|nr:hypothetical protein [Methanocella conradii]MDI6897069.1 hypothetical protein [Methanocella conradii]
MRSCTCKDTVGTSNFMCAIFPAHQSCGSRCGSYSYSFFSSSLSVSGVTRPTGGL